ncbi:glycosyltransferase [Agrococcus casei]|uniref:glycosyltransferase n=1 Tax=Agrococcus casei TaxID=343512 RepID=UPI003F92772E
MKATASDLAVIVPVFNESARVRETLRQLHAQRDDDFDAYFVDNHSTDGSGDIIRAFAAEHGRDRWHVIHEPVKGTGAAADTGMRAAIAAGHTLLARTDADCIPRLDWTSNIRTALTPKSAGGDGLDFLGGLLVSRRDEGEPLWRRKLMESAVTLAVVFGKLRASNRGSQYLGGYIMAPGCNLAIRAETYTAAGGFPRTKIEDLHEDRALVNAVREITSHYAERRDIVVAGSSRRVQAWGLKNTLLWYKDHAYRPDHVDIR